MAFEVYTQKPTKFGFVAAHIFCTVTKQNVRFSQKAHRAIGCPEYVRVLFDDSEKKMAIVPSERKDIKALKLYGPGNQNAIQRAGLVKKVCEVAGINTRKKHSFKGEYDQNYSRIIFDLSEEFYDTKVQ